LSDRLKISQDVLDVQFDVRGQADLLLTSPRCRFDIDSSRITALGAVSWDVTVHAPRGDHTATIIGKARVWQDQLVLTRPLSAGQKILEQDVTTKRAMVDKFDERPLATDVNQIVGQVLTANMQKGDVVYLPCVKGENLVLKDQFVTVALPHEGLMIETVARSLENGARGETVRVRNEATNQIYSIIVTDKASGEVRISGNEKVAATDR
jgi:flagella basal body P-ring formation protein FlgA